LPRFSAFQLNLTRFERETKALATLSHPAILAILEFGQDADVLLTTDGTLLGTLAYVAPEQLRGEPAEARSDLFSLGLVLWEMVAGRRPFQRETTLEAMHAAAKEELHGQRGREAGMG